MDVLSFGQTFFKGALREFCEKTGLDESANHRKGMQKNSNMQHYPLQMVLEAISGLVTNFLFSIANQDAHTNDLSHYRQGKLKVDDF